MPVEKSAGAIVFYRNPDGKIEYLLLQHQSGYWSFPKGLIEEGESPEDAAERETKEESGIENFVLIPGFKETQKYFFKVKYDYQLERGLKKGETIFKTVVFFLTQAETKEVKISSEHENYAWLNYEEALAKIKFDTLKEMLKKANNFLNGEQNTQYIGRSARYKIDT